MNEPKSASDQRPNDEPYFIDSDCPECGEELIYYHELSDEEMRDNEAFANPDTKPDDWQPFYDEFVCPECLDGLHMDWPEEYARNILNSQKEAIHEFKEGESASFADLKEALDW